MSYPEKFGLDNPVFEAEKGDLDKNHVQAEGKHILTAETENERAQWGNGLEFLMSCIAMSVGLGNIWRFPFTAYENGGGAFLIPYIIVLVIIGRPMYYMEMALGQFTSRGNVKMFESLSPALKGIGYGQLIGTICVATYYCSLMALTLFYLANSFTSNLPWAECKKEWEPENALKNITCIPSANVNVSNVPNGISSSELFFIREVLKQKEQIEDGIGAPEWRLTLCLLISWVVTFFVSVKGVQSSGKASYFLAIFPYVIMVTLLVRAATLEGAAEGVLYFIRPQWHKLASADVCIIMYSSYNDFHHNINRDAIVVTTLDTFTSLLAGATIFGILGNLAHELNVPVKNVINSGGTGLAFISYPEAIAKFQTVPWVFAILFFVMLFVLGIGSLVALHGCANTVILDNFPNLKNWYVSAFTATIGFLIGLVYVTPGGQFILTIVDHFGGTMVIFMVAVFETIAIMWWYGSENFCNDLEFMLKNRVGIYWRITWSLITPIILIIIFIYFLLTLTRLSYGPYEISDAALICGWMIVVVTLVQLSYFLISNLYKNRDAGFPKLICKTFNSKNWGPQGAKKHDEWKKFKQQKEEENDSRNEMWLKQKFFYLIGKR